MLRKFVITKSGLVSTIPTDSYHNSVENAVSGGYVAVLDDMLIFFGSSNSFGKPSLEHLQECLTENFYTIENIVTDFEVNKIFLSRCESIDKFNADTSIEFQFKQLLL